jgi:hypothetical protein
MITFHEVQGKGMSVCPCFAFKITEHNTLGLCLVKGVYTKHTAMYI